MWSPPPRKPRIRPSRPVELAAAAGVAVLADVVLWSKDGPTIGGFGLALLFAGLPALVFAAARSWRRPTPTLAAIAGLLVLVALRCLAAPSSGVVLAGFALVLGFALALRAPRVFVPEVALAAVMTPLRLLVRLEAALLGARRLAARTRFGRVSALPIAIPAALVALFLGVFALANPLVARGLEASWSALTSVVSLPSFGRVALFALALVSGVVLLRPAFKRARRAEIATSDGEASDAALSIARNALVGLNVVFFAYNALDLTYLWSGSPPTGMRTQQYAHQGAFWLTVALLLLTAVVGVMFRGPLAHDARAHGVRRLAYAWIAQGLVLALGTYRRIGIHIEKSGLSDLRIVGVLGTTLVVGGVVLVLLKLRSGKTFVWLVRRQLDALAVTAILYAVAPTHLVSAKVNVARVRSGEYGPILHAFRQSHEPESAAALLPLLDHPDERIRKGVAALLADERDRVRSTAASQRSWRERDLVTSHALNALDGASARIDAALGGAEPYEAKRGLLELSRQ